MKNFIQLLLKKLFSKEEKQEPQQNPVKEEVVNPQCECKHEFGRYRFVKGGGRETTCKKCGYIKHVD